MQKRVCILVEKNNQMRLLQCTLLLSALSVAESSHVYTDSFPPNDEYDFGVLDPVNVYGSPFGGFSRATASRLASLPLRLPNVAEELSDFDPVYMHMRDYQGRPYVCRVYHEDELEEHSLDDSMFDMAKVRKPIRDTEPQLKDSTEERDPGNSHPAGEASSGGKVGIIGDTADKSSKTATETVEPLLPTGDALTLAKDLNERLGQLKGMCARVHLDWWSYQWCHEKDIIQFHVNMDEMVTRLQDIKFEDATSLGKFNQREIQIPKNAAQEDKSPKNVEKNSAEDASNSPSVKDIFIAGDICPETKEPRVTEVVYACCPRKEIANRNGLVFKDGKHLATDLLAVQNVFEDKNQVCRYYITLCTPLVCSEPPTTDSSNEVKKQKVALAPEPEAYDPAEIEQKSVEEILEMAFRRSQKSCIQSVTGAWWSYEFCLGKHVRQFHELTLMDRLSASADPDNEYILGKFDATVHESVTKEMDWQHVVNATDLGIDSRKTKGRATPTAHGGNGAYYFQEYTSGDVCNHQDVTDSAIKAGQVGEGGIERATTVRYSCGNQLDITVKEDSTCHYILDVSIPELCYHPLFKASVSKKQVVKCLPAPQN